MQRILLLTAVLLVGLGYMTYSGAFAGVPVLGPFLIERGISSRPDGKRIETYYQYTDEKGRVRFAKDLDEVPPEWRDRAGEIRMAGPPPTSPREARAARQAAASQVPSRPVATSTPGTQGSASSAAPSSGGGSGPAPVGSVILYTKDSCTVCQRAVVHLTQRGVSFVERNIDHDSAAKREYESKVGFAGGIPVFDFGGELLKGYDATKLNAALDRYKSS